MKTSLRCLRQPKTKESIGNEELVTGMTDAICLAIQGCHNVNNTRRQAMKKEPNKDYAALCNSSTVDASSEFLFGDLSKLRWLRTVSSTFQDVDFDRSLLPLFIS